jgi:hypothetical protein
MDYHVHAHSECNAADTNPKKVLQITWRPDSTCSVSWEDAGFRHLHPDLIKQAAGYDKVTLLHPDTGKKKVLKDNGNSVEPYIEE